MVDSLSKLVNLIGLFYDSVLDNAKWNLACEALGDFVGGTGVGFVVANPQLGIVTLCETVRMQPDFATKYLDYYATKEVRLAPSVKYAPGLVMTECMLLDQRELERSEIYGDLLLPADVPHFMFTWLKKSPTAYETIAVENSLKGGAFQGDAIERYRLALPHISRAVRMRDVLRSTRITAETYRAVLDTLPYGAVFLDEHGFVLEATAPALNLLEKGDAMGLFKSTVRAVGREQDLKLQRAINRVVRSVKHRSVFGATLHIERSMSTPLTVYVIALKRCEHLMFTSRPVAMLLLVDPEATPLTGLQRIQHTLQLTRAEAMLAQHLFRGEGLREAALALGISVNTAKSQLKSIYVKTGCSSHVDLARKIMTVSLPPWRFDLF